MARIGGICKICGGSTSCKTHIHCRSCWKSHVPRGEAAYAHKHGRYALRSKNCVICGNTVTHGSRGLCRPCFYIANRGSTSASWKGGVKQNQGRILVMAPDNPMAMKGGYVLRTRLVLAEKIGRPLRGKEIAHHKNRDPMDDRPENITLLANKREHNKLHQWEDS